MRLISNFFFSQYGERYDPSLLSHLDEVLLNRILPGRIRRLIIKRRLRKLPPDVSTIGRKILYGNAITQISPYHQVCREEWWASALRDLERINVFDEDWQTFLSDEENEAFVTYMKNEKISVTIKGRTSHKADRRCGCWPRPIVPE